MQDYHIIPGGTDMNRELMTQQLNGYLQDLREKERSEQTIRQYQRDIAAFLDEAGEKPLDKALVIWYKKELGEKYSPVSVNTKLAAINGFFNYLGRNDLRVRQLRIQKKAYCNSGRELTRREYLALVNTAKKMKNEKLAMLLQTICGTGIRVSELQYITVESIRCGEAVIQMKGKTRTILIAGKLRKQLTRYIKREGIQTGPVFITRNKRPMDRSNIWKMLKRLCGKAGVNRQKVFPHNLRHLFAKCFYTLDKDIEKLADILGHTSINTTRIYIMGSGLEHSRKMDRLGLVI